MSANNPRFLSHASRLLAFALAVACCAAFAQTPAARDKTDVPATALATTRTDVPDGAPELAAEKTVSNMSITAPGKASTSVIVDEERVQGRLANAHVRVGGTKGYTVVDPSAGRTDRQADNAGKRLSPSLWELFRF
jgi:hypothetical protein